MSVVAKFWFKLLNVLGGAARCSPHGHCLPPGVFEQNEPAVAGSSSRGNTPHAFFPQLPHWSPAWDFEHSLTAEAERTTATTVTAAMARRLQARKTVGLVDEINVLDESRRHVRDSA